MAIQTAQIYDINTTSRTGSPGGRRGGSSAPKSDRQTFSPTMSYPQRIAAMLADAPEPPALRRRPPAVLPSLGPETQASLIMVHALNATFG